jgi:carbon-monoxide dehydrogenase medium subunit
MPNEMIVELRFPRWPDRRRWAFAEFSRRRGDFAMAGVAVVLEEDAAEACVDARLVVFGVGDKATRLRKVETALIGRKVNADVISTIGANAVHEAEAQSDIHASARYRQTLTGLLIRQSLRHAVGLPSTEAF